MGAGRTVLILTASIGAGHDVPAARLAEGLEARGVAARVADGLKAMGPIVDGLIRGGSDFDSHAGNAAFDALYWTGTRFAPGHRLTGWLLEALGGRGLMACLERERPAAVVSTYPGATEALGRLRRAGRVDIPVVSAITDLSALWYWAHPGVDLHLVTHPESVPEVRAIAGSEAIPVRGLNPAGFDAPPSREAARVSLGLPPRGGVVLVSGGGWGVGDVEGAVREALDAGAAAVLVLCGTNAGLLERIQGRHRGDERVRAVGFTDRMPELMAAANVLVHSTAGLTVLEAAICGCWTISYGWGRGHIRANNRAFLRTGLAAVAADRAALGRALRDALARPRRPDTSWFALPDAAAVLLERLPVLQEAG